jgi:hypothetical protein
LSLTLDRPLVTPGVGLWIAHFVKRELETFFVHRFSRPTMPLSECRRMLGC